MEKHESEYVLSPDDFFAATVTDFNVDKSLLILVLDSGAKALCLSGKITTSLNGHTCCDKMLYAKCAIRIEESKDPSRFMVLEAQFQCDGIPELEEEVVIKRWKDGASYGTGIRPCGCSLWVSTAGRRRSFAELTPGQVALCSVSESKRKPGLACAYVDRIVDKPLIVDGVYSS